MGKVLKILKTVGRVSAGIIIWVAGKVEGAKK